MLIQPTLPSGESQGLPARWQDHSPTHQPKWHKHVKSKAPQESVLLVPGLQEVCGLAFRQEDRLLSRGALDAAQSRRGFGQVVLRLFPEGAPVPYGTTLLDHVFSECDQDLDGLLLWEDFQEFVLRGLQPLLKGQKTGESPAVKAKAFAHQASNLQAYQPVQKAAEEVPKLPADTPAPASVISAAPVLKDPSGKSRAVGFANVAMVPSARDMTDLLKEYTFPENDAALGRGAFGTVMKVTHNGTGEVRAMKAVRLSGGADSAQLRELVELEISMLKSLDHVNLLRLHEAFRDSESCMYLITELCAGGSLAERLEQQRTLRKPMLEGMAAAYAEQILSAASYCHDRGVLHRDLKPENVLFLTARSDSPVKVIDFGLSDTMERIRQNCTQEIHDRSGALGAVARLLPKLPGGLEILATKETKEVMQRAGTPHYMAPEVYTGMYGDRADVWSIGVILFEMLSNRHPFYTSGNDLEAVKRRILSPEGADFCDPSWGEVTAAAQRACRECLMSDPDRRPSAQRMLAHKWFDTVPRLALGMSGGMDSGRSGFLALARSPPRIAASQVVDALRSFALPGYVGSTRARLRQAFLRLVTRELAEVQQEGLRGAFLRLDCDGDGALSASDLSAGLRGTAPNAQRDRDSSGLFPMLSLHAQSDAEEWLEEIRSLVATAGTVGDKIGFSDFLAVMLPYHVAVQEAQLRSAFSRLADSKSSGRTLPKSTLQTALQVGQAVSDEEVAALNAGLPEELSYAEFVQLVGLHP